MTVPTVPGPATSQLVMRRAAVNDHYRAAVETPEYQEAIELHNLTARRLADLRPVPELPLPDSVDDDLDEWLGIAKRLAAAVIARQTEHSALTSLSRKCEARIQSVVHEKDRMLTSLARALGDVMAAAAEVVARLDGAQNAAQAIERGVADAWQELPPLRAEYDSIRQAQDWVMSGDHRVIHCRSEYLWTDDLATDLAIANLDEVFSDWKHAPRNNSIQQWDNQHRLQPWPPDPTEQFVWLCTSGAQVWCPTTRQLDELKAQRQRARAHPDGPPPQPRPERQLLNSPARPPDYSRIAPALERIDPPPELAQLVNEVVVDLDDPIQVGAADE
jgi:hypothetical protein